MTAQHSMGRGQDDMSSNYHRQVCLPPSFGGLKFQHLPKPQPVSPRGMSDQCTREDRSGHRDVNSLLLGLEKSLVAPPETLDGTGDGKHGVEKPFHSYIALISMAILNSKERKMLLNDIYQYIMDNFPYYNNNEKAWRNSIRHNLSLNECFIKCGRADNGKGHYWSIHPACIEDFIKGDFRRRHARRRAKRNSQRSEVNVSQMPISYRYNIGYVPMTPTSSLGYPYSAYFNSAAGGLGPTHSAQEQTAQHMYNISKNAPIYETRLNHQAYDMTS